MEHLYEKLQRYAEEGIYPYHMPGHKRQGAGVLPDELYRLDITEIEGFDNLHQPEGILRELQERAARLYGAEEGFYLVGGSTCGVLAAVSAAVPAGGHILMARNCHKSAYHAAYLRNLKVSYITPSCLAAYDILDAITPQQVEAALVDGKDIDAVLIVSPTYEGRIADVAAIAAIVHKKGIPLIVDEAHGAHLGLAEGFSLNSCQAGADLVIHSVHKTLPALTQTALLHVNGGLVDRELLVRFLHIYQSSSPSYLLMASIDRALHYVETSGVEAFGQFRKRYAEMTALLADCRSLKILIDEPERQDIGKLVVSVRRTGLTGRQLYDILLQEYGLQLEMAAESYVLAMFTVSDGEEAYRRMTEALLEIDGRLSEAVSEGDGGPTAIDDRLSEVVSKGDGRPTEIDGRLLEGDGGPTAIGGRLSEAEGREKRASTICHTGQMQTEKRIPLAAAWDMESETVALEDSVGKLAAEFVSLYPPGVPLLAPGEYVTEELCRGICEAVEQGLTVQGIRIEEGGGAIRRKISVKVLKLL